MWLIVSGSRNKYDDKQLDEEQMKYLDEWYEIHNKR